MSKGSDPRIEIVFATLAKKGPGDVLLVEAGFVADDGPVEGLQFASFSADSVSRSGHAVGCSCCKPRSDVASALNALFLSRARAETPWFNRVLAVVQTDQGRRAIAEAVRGDELIAARFRLSAPPE